MYQEFSLPVGFWVPFCRNKMEQKEFVIIETMPTINAYYEDEQIFEKIERITPDIKRYVADQLTCNDIQLQPNEVSLRLLQSRGNGMLAPLEMEVHAASFKERIEKQDEICLNIQKFLIEKVDNLSDVKVWLILSELGHSWE